MLCFDVKYRCHDHAAQPLCLSTQVLTPRIRHRPALQREIAGTLLRGPRSRWPKACREPLSTRDLSGSTCRTSSPASGTAFRCVWRCGTFGSLFLRHCAGRGVHTRAVILGCRTTGVFVLGHRDVQDDPFVCSGSCLPCLIAPCFLR